jgi:hypothetical protein
MGSKLKTFRDKFENDPEWQTRFHLWMVYFWLLNIPLVTLVFFFAPAFWSKASIFYILVVSLYANFATDYDAVSASEASTHALRAEQKMNAS